MGVCLGIGPRSLLASSVRGSPKRANRLRSPNRGDARDPVAFEREHDQAVRPANRRVRVGQVDTERRLALARVDTRRDALTPHQSRSRKKRAIAAGPRTSMACGGIVISALSVSSATSRSTSACSNGSACSLSRGERGSGARPRSGRRESTVARAGRRPPRLPDRSRTLGSAVRQSCRMARRSPSTVDLNQMRGPPCLIDV
jgi:hypothetical protein